MWAVTKEPGFSPWSACISHISYLGHKVIDTSHTGQSVPVLLRSDCTLHLPWLLLYQTFHYNWPSSWLPRTTNLPNPTNSFQSLWYLDLAVEFKSADQYPCSHSITSQALDPVDPVKHLLRYFTSQDSSLTALTPNFLLRHTNLSSSVNKWNTSFLQSCNVYACSFYAHLLPSHSMHPILRISYIQILSLPIDFN